MPPNLRSVQRQHQKAAGDREVLQEIPEHLTAGALAPQPKIPLPPELLPKQRRHDAIARQNKRRQAVRYAGKDTKRHQDLNQEARDDQSSGHAPVGRGLAGLSGGEPKVEQLVQCAERQKQQNEREPRQKRDQNRNSSWLDRPASHALPGR